MKTKSNRESGTVKALWLKALALMMALCLLPAASFARAAEDGDWVSFLLICNEGMNNDKGNAGNTMMIVAINTAKGFIRLCMFTWDTFVEYEGYDVPQKLDMPYRNAGAEEALKVFNANFGTGIRLFMSLNYLNLASLIDDYDGVNVDITRAERNALNGMVASKKNRLQDEVGTGLLTQAMLDSLAGEYYLNDYGPNTHLNGLQAVGFGWLQYDSVYNCCEREVEVIGSLFGSVGKEITEKVAFYTDETGYPDDIAIEGKTAINLDNPTESDMDLLREIIEPIFDKAYHNITEEDIETISMALAKTAYQAARQGVNIFDTVETKVLSLEAEAQLPYDTIAGAKGYIIDMDANVAALNEFLYQE